MPEGEAVKVKLGQLAAAAGAPNVPGPLSKLMGVECFSVRVAYRLASLAKKANEALAPFNETKNRLIEKYGEGEGRDKKIGPESDKWDDFLEEYNTLAEEEVDLDIKPVVLPPEAEGVTAETLLVLDGLVTVRGEDAPKSGPSKVVE